MAYEKETVQTKKNNLLDRYDNAIAKLINKVTAPSIDKKNKLLLRAEVALEAFIKGGATYTDVDSIETIAYAVEILGKTIHPDIVNTAVDAQKAMHATFERFKRVNVLGLDYSGIEACRSILDVYSQLLDLCTCGQLVDAFKEAGHSIRRINLERGITLEDLTT